VFSSPKRPLSASIADWNPFSDDNFGEAAEDVMFGHEFDRLRRGSNSSKWLYVQCWLLRSYLLNSCNVILSCCVCCLLFGLGSNSYQWMTTWCTAVSVAHGSQLHFWDCKVMLVTDLTRVSSAVTVNFTFIVVLWNTSWNYIFAQRQSSMSLRQA